MPEELEPEKQGPRLALLLPFYSPKQTQMQKVMVVVIITADAPTVINIFTMGRRTSKIPLPHWMVNVYRYPEHSRGRNLIAQSAT